MKRLLPIIMTLLTSASYAQHGFGIHAGYCRASVGDYNYKSSGMAGVHFQFNSLARSSVRTELNYVARGGKKDAAFTTNTGGAISNKGESVVALNYIQLPVIYKMRFEGEKSTAYIEAGPYASYLLSAYHTLYPPLNSGIKDARARLDINRVDIGAVAGVGVHLRKASIGIRYERSIGNIDFIKHNSAMSIILGFKIK